MKAEAQEPAVLGPILEATRRRVARLRPPAGPAPARPPEFAAALKREFVAVIAEVKRRSPSAGSIRENADAGALAAQYARGGASAISVLTEPDHFGGSLGDLAEAARQGVPVLCKDFVIDERQLAAAAHAGAAAALLIGRILGRSRLAELLVAARQAGLDALVEVHNEGELDDALAAGAAVIGVNARDLDSLRLDPALVVQLLPRIPDGVVRVAESGIGSRADVERYRDAGADAVLVGTTVASAADPEAAVRSLVGVERATRRAAPGSAPADGLEAR